MYHVKATAGPFPGGLDLNVSDEEEFSPDKLRVNVERLYMTVVCTSFCDQNPGLYKYYSADNWHGSVRQAYRSSPLLEGNQSHGCVLCSGLSP